MKIKYAAYIRKSTEDEERQVLSKGAQKDKIEEFFPDLDIEWFDDSKSAYKPFQRPGFQKMMDKVQDGSVQGLIAWHPDRLSRNEVDASTITWALRQGLIKDMKFASFSFDNSAEGIMMLQMTMSHSQYFSAKLSKDVKRGVGKKLKDGGHSGVAPEGYINNRADKTIEKDPVRFEMVRSIFEKFLEGYTIAEIKLMLEQKGYKTIKRNKVGGKHLARSTYYKILTNPRYYGRIPNPDFPDDPDKMFIGKYPRMITREQFEQVQYILGSRGRTRYVSKKYFELKGLLKCGECGCSVTAERKSKSIKDGSTHFYNYYHCTHKRPDCTQRGVTREQDIFEQLDTTLNNYSLPTVLYQWGLEAISELAEKEATERLYTEDIVSGSTKQIEAKLDSLLELIEDGTITKDTYKKRYEKLTNELILSKKNEQQIMNATKNWYELVGKTFDRLHNAVDQFQTGDLAKKRDVLLAIGYNSTLKDDLVEITPYDWLKPLEAALPDIKDRLDKVITNNINASQSINSTKKDSLESLMSSWQGHVESNHDPRFWRPIY